MATSSGTTTMSFCAAMSGGRSEVLSVTIATVLVSI
jgi:hypothetical protein